MNVDDQDTRNPNADTFDHVGARAHETTTPPFEVQFVERIGEPADQHGDVYAPGSIKATGNVPVLLAFNFDQQIGVADVRENGTGRIKLYPQAGIDPAMIEHVGISFRPIRSHWDGDVIRILDEIEVVCLGVTLKVQP